jgi:hypothetical protein
MLSSLLFTKSNGTIVKKMALRAAVSALFLIAGTAFAGTIGTASVNDVTLEGEAADVLKYSSGVNPQGSAGSIGFASAFASYGTGAWTKIGKFETNADNGFSQNSVAFGTSLLMSFDKLTTRNGTWTVSNTDTKHHVELDLVFAMHTGGGSGAWLFDELRIEAGQTLDGTWVQNLLNNGGKKGDFSNLTIFARNAELIDIPPVVDVAEPATIGTLMRGAGLIGFLRRRRNAN